MAEKAELAAAVAALEEEANRAGEVAQRNAALAEDQQQTLAAREHAEASAKEELGRNAREVDRGGNGAGGTADPAVCPTAHEVACALAARLLVHAPASGRLAPYRGLRAAPPLRHFSADAYLAENPDVDASGLDPLMHYVEHGIREGRALAPTPSEAIFAADDVASPAIEPDEPP